MNFLQFHAIADILKITSNSHALNAVGGQYPRKVLKQLKYCGNC